MYNLNKEGYYYLIDFKKGISRNIIIFKNNTLSLLSSLSWLSVHGNLDRTKSFNQKLSKIVTKKLSVTCGSISKFTSKILNQYNINNRIVTFLTMDKWNTYDNGHTLIEVKVKNKYIVFDLDNNQYFQLNNQLLQIKDFFNIDFNKLSFIKLSNDPNLDSQGFNNNNISYHGFGDFTNNHLIDWYKRVMQVPIIVENGKYYVGLIDKSFTDRLLQYYPKAIILNKNEFIKKFYGEK